MLTMRSSRGKSDLDEITHLLKTCEAVDPPDKWPSGSDILMQFDAPSVDMHRDIRLWQDTDGRLMASSGLMIPSEAEEVLDGFLWFRIHPRARVDTLYRQIIAWGEERMREVGQERGMEVKLLSAAVAEQTEDIALLESCGFRIERYFLTMVRLLTEPIPEPQLPEGFTLRHLQSITH